MKRSTQVLATLVVLASVAIPADAFQFGNRWARTAVSGAGLTQGDPTTVTWGFVPDGTNIASLGTSDLISRLDSWIGAGPGGSDLTQRPWFDLYEQSFNRFAEVSGLSYQYEAADDGVTQGSNANAGFVGVRADVRIAGDFIDGPSNTLAFNNFPQNGDMTFDTGDGGAYSNGANNFRFLRNTIMHEHGHGLGYFHVESATARFLMEPFLQTNFDGPQFDEILGLHRGYGDVNEKSNGGAGNDIAANATDFGVLPINGSMTIGTDANNVIVAPSETDFVSIDDNSDTDFYSFTVNSASELDIVLTPMGPSYFQGPQGGSQANYVTKEFSDLSLALIDTNGSTVLDLQNAGGTGDNESILDFNVNPGEYFVRITGAANNVQMYQLQVSVDSGIAIEPGDFNADGIFDCADVDALVGSIVIGDNNEQFDLTGEGVVNGGDLDVWLQLAGAANLASGNAYLEGDANLDGTVDGGDFVIWNANKFTSSSAWCDGDFNHDGSVDGGDFVLWNANKFQTADGVSAVPEPASWLFSLMAVAALGFGRRR